MGSAIMNDQDKYLRPVPEPFRGLRVLLVDSNTQVLLDTAQRLENFSYKVTTTELAAVALSILQERKDSFDLVVADIKMPEMKYIEFIDRVRLIKELPIILMATDLKRDTMEQAIKKGVCFFLSKPTSSKQLKDMWQHVRRKWGGMKKADDQEIKSQGAAQGEDLAKKNGPENEQILGKGNKAKRLKRRKTADIAEDSDLVQEISAPAKKQRLCSPDPRCNSVDGVNVAEETEKTQLADATNNLPLGTNAEPEAVAEPNHCTVPAAVRSTEEANNTTKESTVPQDLV